MDMMYNPFEEETTGCDCIQPVMYIFDKQFNAAVDTQQRQAIFILLNIAKTKNQDMENLLKNILDEEQYRVILKEYIYNYNHETQKFNNTYGFADESYKIGNTLKALYIIAGNADKFYTIGRK